MAAPPAEGGGAGGSGIGMLIWMVLLMGGFWFLIIGPQRKKQKQHEKMVGELKNGDEIITMGGIYGTISNVKNDRFTVKIADGVRVDVTKSSVATVVDQKDEKSDK